MESTILRAVDKPNNLLLGLAGRADLATHGLEQPWERLPKVPDPGYKPGLSEVGRELFTRLLGVATNRVRKHRGSRAPSDSAPLTGRGLGQDAGQKGDDVIDLEFGILPAQGETHQGGGSGAGDTHGPEHVRGLQ